MATVKTIKIEESVFADNDTAAESIRRKLTEKKTTMINVMSSPGSGKTTLLTQIVKRLGSEMRIRVMDVDIESTLDAQRVADDLLKGKHGNLYTIVCRVNAKLVKHGRAAFKRGWVRAEEKLWRLGA